MSSAYVLVAFAVCILLMILFISKWKIHPVTSILVATIILAISIGTPWDKIEEHRHRHRARMHPR